MDFPLYFQKVIEWGGDSLFANFFLLKKPITPEYAQVLVVTWAKPNSVTALLSHRPIPVFKYLELKYVVHCLATRNCSVQYVEILDNN